MMIEHEDDGIKVNIVSPRFTNTARNNNHGTATSEEGSRELLRVCKFGPNDPSGTFPMALVRIFTSIQGVHSYPGEMPLPSEAAGDDSCNI